MTKILANDGISQAGIDALTEKGFDVIKSISSSYLGAPLKVRASYIKK